MRERARTPRVTEREAARTVADALALRRALAAIPKAGSPELDDAERRALRRGLGRVDVGTSRVRRASAGTPGRLSLTMALDFLRALLAKGLERDEWRQLARDVYRSVRGVASYDPDRVAALVVMLWRSDVPPLLVSDTKGRQRIRVLTERLRDLSRVTTAGARARISATKKKRTADEG